MIIGKRSLVRQSQFNNTLILEWDRAINGMNYHFVGWTMPDGSKFRHVFVYPHWGEMRLYNMI